MWNLGTNWHLLWDGGKPWKTRIELVDSLVIAAAPRYIASARTAQKTPPPTVPPLLLSLLLRPLPNNSFCIAAYFAVLA
jgi:hypothetical protein